MEKLKEDYISIDTRLEYMEAIAVEYVPDVDIDLETGEQYICGTTALPIFIRRCNQNKLYGNFTYEDYIANEDIQNTLKGLGVDIDKFWFLLLFIFDYTCGTCLDGMKATGIGIEQLTKFAQAIADNHKEINQFGVSFKKPITISVKIEGKHQIVIDNANAIGYLATTIINNLKEIEEHPWMQSQQVSISTHAEEKESIQIYLFIKCLTTSSIYLHIISSLMSDKRKEAPYHLVRHCSYQGLSTSPSYPNIVNSQMMKMF